MKLFLIGVAIILWFGIGFYFGKGISRENLMQEAFQRGHAVQCAGQLGYHWECE